jgi:hypothetical protein
MAVAMLPEPMMLMVVMMNVPPWCWGEHQGEAPCRLSMPM